MTISAWTAPMLLCHTRLREQEPLLRGIDSGSQWPHLSAHRTPGWTDLRIYAGSPLPRGKQAPGEILAASLRGCTGFRYESP